MDFKPFQEETSDSVNMNFTIPGLEVDAQQPFGNPQVTGFAPFEDFSASLNLYGGDFQSPPAQQPTNVAYPYFQTTSDASSFWPVQATTPVVASNHYSVVQAQGNPLVPFRYSVPQVQQEEQRVRQLQHENGQRELTEQQLQQLQMQQEMQRRGQLHVPKLQQEQPTLQQRQQQQQQQLQQLRLQEQQRRQQDLQKLPFNLTIARRWLKGAQASMNNAPIHTAPVIEPSYRFQMPSSMPLYFPDSAWNVRCMNPKQRHNLYKNLCTFAGQMFQYSPGSPAYRMVFRQVIETSYVVAEHEMHWYAWWEKSQHGDLHSRQATFAALVDKQSKITEDNNLQPMASGDFPVNSTPTPGVGTTADTPFVIQDDDALDTSANPKPASPKSHLKRQAKPQEETEEVRAKRAKIDAKVKADRAMYEKFEADINTQYLERRKPGQLRKPTDSWYQKLEAWAFTRQIRKASENEQSDAIAGQFSLREQGQSYPSDRVRCPKLPSHDLEDYEVKDIAMNTYYCFHREDQCRGLATCSKGSHQCCRTGFELRMLERRVITMEQRLCRKIEELVTTGLLDSRHKTWDGYFDGGLRAKFAPDTEKPMVDSLNWTEQGSKLAKSKVAKKKQRRAKKSAVVATAAREVASPSEDTNSGDDLEAALLAGLNAEEDGEVDNQSEAGDDLEAALLAGLSDDGDAMVEANGEPAIHEGLVGGKAGEEESEDEGEEKSEDDEEEESEDDEEESEDDEEESSDDDENARRRRL